MQELQDTQIIGDPHVGYSLPFGNSPMLCSSDLARGNIMRFPYDFGKHRSSTAEKALDFVYCQLPCSDRKAHCNWTTRAW